MQLPVRLLDGTCHHVVVAKGATVKDVLVALRRCVALFDGFTAVTSS